MNGGFEALEGGQPAGWAKVGGEFHADPDAYAGEVAAVLVSGTNSTKWVHQLAAVEPGGWYEADAQGRLRDGAGGVWLRLSWYAAADGTGEAIGASDGPITSGAGWASLATGPVQAPTAAHSVRVRLMYRPAGAGSAAFDDVSLYESDPPEPSGPTPTPTDTTGPGATSSPGAAAPAEATGPAATRAAAPPARTPAPGRAAVGAATVVPDGRESLRLSEVMPDPESQPDNGHEWVEVVNVGDEPVSTAGWKVGNGRELDSLPAVTIPPGGFAIIAAKSAVLVEGVLLLVPADGTIGGGLRNAGDLVRLVAPSGAEVDAISYGDRTEVFDPALPAPSSDVTLGAKAPGADAGAENWALTLRPTPGEANVFPAARTAENARTDGGTASGADGPDGRGETAAAISEPGGSAVPWIVLSVAAAIGGGGLTVGLQRALPRLRRRGET